MPITAEQQDLRNQLLEPTESQQALRKRLLGVQRPEGQEQVMKDLPFAIQDGVYFEDVLNSESRELFKQRLSVSDDPNFIRDKHVASLKIAFDNDLPFEDAYAMFDDYAKTKYEGNSKAAAADLKKQLGETVAFSEKLTPEQVQEEKVLERKHEIQLDPIKAFPEEFHSLYKPLNSKEWEQARGRRIKPGLQISPFAPTVPLLESPVPQDFYQKSKFEQIALTMDARAKLLPEGDPLKEKYSKWKSVIGLRMSLLAAPFEEVEKRQRGGVFPEVTRGAVSGLIDIAGRGLEIFAREIAPLSVFDPEQVAKASVVLREFAQTKALSPPEGDSYAFQMGRVSSQLGAGFAAFLTTGNPYAFGVPIGILEYSNTREEALAAGATEEQAELAATGVALVNMAIEQWQFKTIRGFATKGVRDAIRKRATNFTMKNALAFTGAVTLDSAKLMATGAIQEGIQSTVSGGAVAIFDPSSIRNIPKQALMEGWYGAGAELLFGGLGRVWTNAKVARQNAQTRKALVSLDEALVEDTGIAPARAAEIVNEAVDLAAKATDKDEAAKVFLTSVNDQLGTKEAVEQEVERPITEEIAETERFEVVEPTPEATAAPSEAELPAEGIKVPPKPTGAIEGKGLPKDADLTYKDKIADIAEGDTKAAMQIYEKHVEETGKQIAKVISERTDIANIDKGDWGSATSYYFDIENADGEQITIRISDHPEVYGGVDISLNSNDSVKENIEIAKWLIEKEWGKLTEAKPVAAAKQAQPTLKPTGAITEPSVKIGKEFDYAGAPYKITDIEGDRVTTERTDITAEPRVWDKAGLQVELAKQAQPTLKPTGAVEVIDNETGKVLKFNTRAEADAKIKELRQEQAGGISFEKIQWKRKSGEVVETTRGELTVELNRLTSDLDKRLADNKIKTTEDVKQAESDWQDINSMRESLGYAKGEKPFKIIRAKGKDIRTIKNIKSRIWQSIKPKTASGLTTSQVINAVMKGMEKSARNAFQEGAREVVKNHKNLAAYAKARLKGLVVNNATVNKLLSAVSRPRTTGEQVSAMAAIEVIAQRAEHAKAVSDLKKTVMFVNKKTGQIMQKGGIRPEFLERIQDVLNSFVFKKPSGRKIKGRKQTLQQRVVSLKKHLEGLRSSLDSKYNREFAEELLPTRLVESVDKLGVSSLADMTAEEIDEINRDITSLLHQNRTKNRLILERIARNAAEDINQMMAESDNVTDKKLIEVGDEVKPKPEGAMGKAVAVTGGRFNHGLETLIDTLDGGQFGILHKNIAQNFSDGRRKRARFFKKLDTFVEAEMKKAGITLDDVQELSPAFYRMLKGKKGLKLRDKILVKIGIVEKHKTHEVILGGKRFNLTMAEIMSIYMHAQAKYNLMAMLESGVAVQDGVTNVVSRVRDVDVTEIEAIDKLIKSNPKALRLCEIAAETYDTIFKDAINQVSVSLKGIELAKEENYWHIQRYRGKVWIPGTETYRISELESEGRLQKREGSDYPIRINDFFAQTLADRQAIGEYVGMAQAYRAAKMLLNYKPWQEKMELKGYGDELEKLAVIIKRTSQSKQGGYDITSGFVGKLLRGLTRSVLGNPVIMASQYVSVHGYFTETDFKYIKALKFLPFQKDIDRYLEHWTRYWERMNGVVSSIALQELTNSDQGLRVLFHKTDYINLITVGIHKVDMMAITEAGRITEAEMADDNLGGKAKKYWDREGINPTTLEFESTEYWDAFNKRADYLVRRTQPMFDKENRSVLTGAETGLTRSFVLFRSYIDQPLRMFARNQTALANNQISKKEYAQQTGLILGGLYGYALLRHILDKLIYQDDDDVSDVMLEMMMSPVKLLTFVGYPILQLSKRVFDIAKGKRVSFFTPEFDTIATSFVDSVLDNSTEIATGIGFWLKGDTDVFQSGPRKWELKSSAYISDGVKGLFIDILTLIGIPTRTASKIYDGWLKENEEVFKL